MDATLQIIIRAQARQAQQAIAQTGVELGRLQRIGDKLNNAKFQSFFDAINSSKMIKAGKNLQWLGRQLLYNFTLPLGIAGVALFKFTQNVERELTNLRKVYGDVNDDQKMLRAETDALATSFKLLSSYFGVNQAEVAKIGAAWAQAGSAGRGLAENVKQTLELMILGDMEAEKATQSLIAVQGTWRLSTKKSADGTSELSRAMGELNIIENQTGISFEGLIDVYTRAGGMARTTGMQFGELGAFAAALVPATGSAAQAGNSMRTILSRLVAPTNDMVEALDLMGITVKSPEWLGMSARSKLELIADRFQTLSTSQQSFVSSILASRWQVNRFSVLMQDLASDTGYYQKALDATADKTTVLNTYNRELQQVLQSSPKRWDIMTNTMRNALADAFIPLLPAIFSIMGAITQLAQKFSELSPNTQKWIIYVLALIATVGPILILIGSFKELIGVVGVTIRVIGKDLFLALFKVGQAMVNLTVTIIPPLLRAIAFLITEFVMLAVSAVAAALDALVAFSVFLTTTLLPAVTVFGAEISVSLFGALLAIGVVVGAIMLIMNDDFRNGVWDVIKSIGEAFWKLPGIIADVFNAIIRLLSTAMQEVVDLLSYLNPFARHSPSLVDNVKAGVSTILDEYARLRQITPLIQNSINALNDFGMANSGLIRRRREVQLREKAAQPGVQGGDQIVNSILALEDAMPALSREISSQKIVVAQWTAALTAADARLTSLQDQLDATQNSLDSVTSQIDAANNEINRLASVPLTGMKAMEDQLFANDMATKQLQLQMLEFEKSGQSVEKVQDKLAALNGELEMLQGTREDLRLAGAGSDILKTYDEQINAIQDQKAELHGTQNEIAAIQDQLDALDLERRFLELTQSLTFDPLIRQIDEMANHMDEMSFDQVVAGIQAQQQLLAQLLPQQQALTAQVQAQTAAVDEAQAAHDAVAARLDIEQQKLDGLEQAYTDINNLIREMETLLSDVNQAAVDDATAKAGAATSDIQSMFDAGAGVDFPVYGGDTALGREGGLADINKFNDEMQKALEDMLAGMGIGDMFAPIKEQWERFKGWIHKQNQEFIDLWTGIGKWLWNFFKPGGVWDKATLGFLKNIWNAALDSVQAGWAKVKAFFGGIWQEIKNIFSISLGAVVGFFQRTWDQIVAGWNAFWGTMTNVGNTLGGGFMSGIETGLGAMAAFFQTIWDGITAGAQVFWDNGLGQVFHAIIDFINNYIVPILQVFQVTFLIVLRIIQIAVQVAWDTIHGIWDAMVSFLRDIVVGAFEWSRDRIVQAWNWMGTQIEWVDDHLIHPTFEGIDWFIHNVLVGGFEWGRDRIVQAWNWVGTQIKWVRDNLIEPAFSGIDWFIHNVLVGGFEWGRDRIVGIWNYIGDVINDVWHDRIRPIFTGFADVFQNYIQPAFRDLYNNVIKPIMSGIVSVFATGWNAVAAAIEGGVNFFINAFNTLASAINKVAGLLGIDQQVSSMPNVHLPRFGGNTDFAAADKLVNSGGAWTMPQAGGGGSGAVHLMAAGGKVGKEGGPVTGMRAIVGEGSNIYPEYVVPTDPRYKNRALGLYSELGKTLMGGDGLGDVFGAAKKMATNALKGAGGLLKTGAIKAIWDPAKWATTQIINQTPNAFFKQAGMGVLNIVDNWMRGSDQAWEQAVATQLAPNPGGQSGSWQAIPPYLASHGIPFKILSTFRPGAHTRFTGALSMHALNRAIDLSGPSGMINYNAGDLLKINQAIYQGFKPYLHELIYGGPGAKNVYNGADHQFSNTLLREHINHVHASLARGGFVVPRQPGGAVLRLGEGLYNEKVQVTPLDGRHGDGGTTINFYDATFEFPNITDPNDAERFLSNLEALAGG